MAFILSPRQLGARSDLYYQIGSSLSGGLPLVRALELLARNPPARGLSVPLRRLSHRLKQGDTFGEALRSLGRWAPDFDITLLEAGEQSGRLDQTCQLLAQAYQDRARLARHVLLGIAYPLLIFHFAFLIMPIGHLIDLVQEGNVALFVIRKLAIFLPLHGLMFGIAWAIQSSRSRAWRAAIEAVTRRIPVVARARRAMALARLSAALDALQNAGVPAIRAWPIAARATGSAAFESEIERWLPRIENGESPGDIIVGSRRFPQHFASIYASAEISGRVDEALPRLTEHYQQEGLRLMRRAAYMFVGLVYGAVMLIAAYQIITFWVGHYNRIVDTEL
jgi:type II secretory pathway component PulF